MAGRRLGIIMCVLGGWAGALPVTEYRDCSEATMDLLFVLDGSQSVNGHFDKVIEWVKNITKPFEGQMHRGDIQIGVVQYSHYFQGREWMDQKFMSTEIDIGEFRSYEDFKRALDKIKLQGYTTYTGRVLEKVVSDFNSSKRINMTNNKQVMILVTDGRSTDPQNVEKKAEALRKMGIITYAVGVANADQTELQLIATGNENSTERVYNVESFDLLGSLVKELRMKIFTTLSKVRLVGGPDTSQGRVEVLRDCEWGTVCGKSWNIQDADVVCRTLGYHGASAAHADEKYGPGAGSIWSDIACVGDETDIMHCPYARVEKDNECDHYEDANVKCIFYACPDTTVDLVFVLDGSGSVQGHFQQLKEFVKNVTKPLARQLELDYIRMGVVQYSHYFSERPWEDQQYIKSEIEIGEFKVYKDFTDAVDGIYHQGFTTYTGRALEKVAADFNASNRFNTTDNKQIMLLVTDGKSEDPDHVRKNAEALRKMGVTTYAVGVQNAEERELKLIATGDERSMERVYTVEEFDQLDSLVDTIQTEILTICKN